MLHFNPYQIVAILLLTAYLIAVYINFGWLKSISASFYELGKKGYLFTLTLWVVAILAIISHPDLLMFLSGASLCITAAAANYKFKLEGKVHVAGAILSMVLGFASLIFNDSLWYLIPAVATGAFYLWANSNKMYHELVDKNGTYVKEHLEKKRVEYPIYWVEIVGFYLILILI